MGGRDLEADSVDGGGSEVDGGRSEVDGGGEVRLYHDTRRVHGLTIPLQPLSKILLGSSKQLTRPILL